MTVLTRVLCTSHNTATEGSTRASSYQSCDVSVCPNAPKNIHTPRLQWWQMWRSTRSRYDQLRSRFPSAVNICQLLPPFRNSGSSQRTPLSNNPWMIAGSIISFSSISRTFGPMTSWANRLTVSRSIFSSSVKFQRERGVSIAGRVISWTLSLTGVVESARRRREGAVGLRRRELLRSTRESMLGEFRI